MISGLPRVTRKHSEFFLEAFGEVTGSGEPYLVGYLADGEVSGL